MRRWLQKIIPSYGELKDHPSLARVRHLLNRPHIWAIHRRASARAVAVGVFINFLPLPFQMLWAALLAIFIRANLPIAVAITWINNPLTFIPINFFIYLTGEKILTFLSVMQSPSDHSRITFEKLASIHWIDGLYALGIPYITGLAFLCIFGSLLAYLLVSVTWKIIIYVRFRKRHTSK